MGVLSGIIDVIKNRLKNKDTTQPEQTTITTIDTSSVEVKKYDSLDDEDRNEVDKIVEGTVITTIKDILDYNKKFDNYYQRLVRLLLDEYSNGLESFGLEGRGFSNEELLEAGVHSQIFIKKITIYLKILNNLVRELRLKIVALDKIHEKWRKENRLKILKNRINKRMMNSLFNSTKEQIKIEIMGITPLILVAEDNRDKCQRLIDKLEGYTEALGKEKYDEEAKEIIEDRIRDAEVKYRCIFNANKELFRDNMTIEEEYKKIAELQLRISIYALFNQQEIEKIRKRISEILSSEIKPEDKKKLLKEINEYQIKYEIFRDCIDVEKDFYELFQAKFKILTSDINQQSKSPFEDMEVEAFEFGYYCRIIEEKITEIRAPENVMSRFFSEGDETSKVKKQVAKFVRKLDSILKDNNKQFDSGKILRDRTKLSILLAFDKPDGFKEVTINKEEIHQILGLNNAYDWDIVIPIKTICQLMRQEYKMYLEKSNNRMLGNQSNTVEDITHTIDPTKKMVIEQITQLYYMMYGEEINKEREDDETKKICRMPKGIINGNMAFNDKDDTYKTIEDLHQYYTIIWHSPFIEFKNLTIQVKNLNTGRSPQFEINVYDDTKKSVPVISIGMDASDCNSKNFIEFALNSYIKKLIKIAKILFEDEKISIDENLSIKEKVTKSAELKERITEYARTHLSEIEMLKSEVEHIFSKSTGSQSESKEELLKELETIQVKLDVFSIYVNIPDDSYWERFYYIKFTILTSNINNMVESPFSQIEMQKKEIVHYEKILEKIFFEKVSDKTGLGWDFENNLCADKLYNRNNLCLLLALTRQNGLEEATINISSPEISRYFNREYFVWDYLVPLSTIWQIRTRRI